MKSENTKGGIMSEDVGGFLPLPKNIPKNYLKLSYPVHNNDKILVGFNRLHVKNFIVMKYKYKIESLLLICACIKGFDNIGFLIMVLKTFLYNLQIG